MHAAIAQVSGDAAPAGAPGTATLGDREFAFLRDFVYQHLGIALSGHKRQLVQGRLARRLRKLRLPDYAAYCDLLRADKDGELGELASVISTNVTAFFREPHHYELLENELLPQWLDRKRRDGDRLRIWSAGCSSGEEPYAIAMVLAEALEKAGAAHLDAKILATDLSPQVLETARAGVYAIDKLGGISAERRHRWLLRGAGANEGYVRVHPRLRELVTVQPLNLLHDWPMKGPFDAIFCRNVVIYFDTPTKKRLFSRYAALLPAGGYLFLGHSESMHGINDDFELVGRTAYRKKA
ncbi:MAG TPA: protein-glutamate O-methyltransferase CheR [Rhodanobacter sp.]|nr:protein-glutamate O-methyltransferase CheR [Rhodanobacter sp.]